MTEALVEKPELKYEDLEVGRAFRRMRFAVTRELVDRYVAIVGDDNPLYAAAEAEPDGTALPGLTPPGLWGVWGRQSYLQDHRMPGGGVLAGEDLVFIKPVTVGQVLDIEARVVERYVRKGRGNVIFEVAATDDDGMLCGIVRITAVWPS